jgi:hypothetical protein
MRDIVFKTQLIPNSRVIYLKRYCSAVSSADAYIFSMYMRYVASELASQGGLREAVASSVGFQDYWGSGCKPPERVSRIKNKNLTEWSNSCRRGRAADGAAIAYSQLILALCYDEDEDVPLNRARPLDIASQPTRAMLRSQTISSAVCAIRCSSFWRPPVCAPGACCQQLHLGLGHVLIARSHEGRRSQCVQNTATGSPRAARGR